MKTIIWLMYVCLCFYCVVDSWSTHLIIMNGGYEVNPLMAWAMETIDLSPFIVLLLWKLFFLFFLGMGLLIKTSRQSLKEY